MCLTWGHPPGTAATRLKRCQLGAGHDAQLGRGGRGEPFELFHEGAFVATHIAAVSRVGNALVKE